MKVTIESFIKISVFSTLMVLLAQESQDFLSLWNFNGTFNDPLRIKHTLDPSEVIPGGNFRSAIVDNWTDLEFESVNIRIGNS